MLAVQMICNGQVCISLNWRVLPVCICTCRNIGRSVAFRADATKLLPNDWVKKFTSMFISTKHEMQGRVTFVAWDYVGFSVLCGFSFCIHTIYYTCCNEIISWHVLSIIWIIFIFRFLWVVNIFEPMYFCHALPTHWYAIALTFLLLQSEGMFVTNFWEWKLLW